MLHLKKLLLLLCVLCVKGVFGVDGDEVKSVSVMEGDSVTLHTDITEIQRDDLLLWLFGPQGFPIAQIHEKNIIIDDTNEIFRNRLKLDSQTGSLTITNITITQTGLYQIEIIKNRKTSYNKFNVVYARLPIPDITCTNSPFSLSSSSKCVLLCSVLNVRDVSLSWYKGNSLLSSISVSDLNIRLSLPLEVDYQDNNTYSCVVNNPNTNQTQHLNINDVCQCSGSGFFWWCLAVLAMILILAAVAVAVKYRKRSKQTAQDGA